MSCSACKKRSSVRLRDTTQATVPIQKQPNTQNTAQAQGNQMRSKLRFTGR